MADKDEAKWGNAWSSKITKPGGLDPALIEQWNKGALDRYKESVAGTKDEGSQDQADDKA